MTMMFTKNWLSQPKRFDADSLKYLLISIGAVVAWISCAIALTLVQIPGIIATIVADTLVLIIAIGSWLASRPSLPAVRFKRIDPYGLSLSLIWAFVFCASGWVGGQWLAMFTTVSLDTQGPDYSSPLAVIGTTGLNLFMIFIAPVAEELLFRRFVFNRLRSQFTFLPAALISSTLFALVHGNGPQMAFAMILGMSMCVLTQRFKNISAAVVAHSLVNALACFGLPVGLTNVLFHPAFAIAALAVWTLLLASFTAYRTQP